MRQITKLWIRGACAVLCALLFVCTAADAATLTLLTPDGVEVVEPKHNAEPPSRAVQTFAPDVSAAAYAVFDVQAERLIAASNADAVLPMASTTKIMTAILAIEAYSLDDTVQFDKSMTAIGSSMYLKYGEVVTVRDLLYGLMLMSGNDAARALASHFEGGEAAFVAAMNDKARDIGLLSTSFTNPNGLDAEGHHTTASELARLAAYALQNPVFREIAETKSGTFAGRLMNNHNRLLRSIDGCIGVKTGYTTGAGRCLVSAVERDGRAVVVVTLRCSNDWNAHTRLHEWAQSSFTVREVAQDSYTLAVVGGDGTSVVARHAERLCLSLGDDEAARLVTRVYLPRFVYAEVSEGDLLGRVEVLLDDKVLAKTELVASSGVVRVQPSKLSMGARLQDFFETLAWSLGF